MRLLTLALFACKPAVTPTETGVQPTDPPPTPGFCQAIEAEHGVVCLEALRNDDRFDLLADPDVIWLVPVTSTIPAVALNTSTHSLVSALPLLDPTYEGLEAADLDDLIYGPDRAFSTGRLSRGDRMYFSFEQGDDWAAPYDDIEAAWDLLQDLVHEDARMGQDLVFDPDSTQADVVLGWRPRFEVRDLDLQPVYVPYVTAEAVGTLRILDRLAYETGRDVAAWGPEDILVLEDAEGDVERVLAGVITDEPVNPFGRLAQRSGSRGTALCFMAGATTTLAAHADQLVRVTCGDTGLEIESATEADATAFRAGLVGDAVAVVAAEPIEVALLSLLDLEPGFIGTYGLEATRLAAAYEAIGVSHQLRGAVVPVSFYFDFLERNTWVVDLGSGPAQATFADTLVAWHADPDFTDDPVERRVRLESLVLAMHSAAVDPLLLERLNDLMPTLWGSPLTGLRFRASVNLEDSAVLPFADLYDAASGCLADDVDSDPLGPSWCDAQRPEERLAAVAIAEVYASLWSFAAYEQRAHHGVDSSQVAMALLVTDSVGGELADAVTWSPGGRIAVQSGNTNAVARANEYPALIEVSDRPVWTAPSSEVSRGDLVITAEQAVELISLTEDLALTGPWVGEWKLLATDQWALKHVQPVRTP